MEGKIVTLDIDNKNVSNTFIVHEVNKDEHTAYLHHPLYEECFIKVCLDDLDTVAPNIKDSTEKCLDFAKEHISNLDYNTTGDLEALCIYFVIKRQLTPKQKSTLAKICGSLASIQFNDSVDDAMRYIKENQAVLDDFNRMWFNNFRGLFNGSQAITSNKQRTSIFNMAGFVLAELSNPKASK